MNPVAEILLLAPSLALLVLFLVSIMISIGMEVTGRQILSTFTDYGLMARSLLANIVFVPMLGMVLVKLFAMPPDIATGFLLLAVAPGAPQAIQFTSKVKGSIPYATALLFILSVVAVVVTPLIADFILPMQMLAARPVAPSIGFLIVTILLPLLIGLAMQQWASSLVEVLKKPLVLCADVSFVLLVLLTLGLRNRAVFAVGGAGLAAMALLIAGSMGIGWLLGGPDAGARQVLAAGTSMRNVVVCLGISLRNYQDTDVDAAIVMFGLLMLLPNIVLVVYQNRKTKLKRAGFAGRSDK